MDSVSLRVINTLTPTIKPQLPWMDNPWATQGDGQPLLQQPCQPLCPWNQDTSGCSSWNFSALVIFKNSPWCVPTFSLSKSEDYYSILSLSPKNWEGCLLLGRLMGFSCFCLHFSQSQHFYFQCSPAGPPRGSQLCLSHWCHAHL